MRSSTRRLSQLRAAHARPDPPRGTKRPRALAHATLELFATQGPRFRINSPARNAHRPHLAAATSGRRSRQLSEGPEKSRPGESPSAAGRSEHGGKEKGSQWRGVRKRGMSGVRKQGRWYHLAGKALGSLRPPIPQELPRIPFAAPCCPSARGSGGTGHPGVLGPWRHGPCLPPTSLPRFKNTQTATKQTHPTAHFHSSKENLRRSKSTQRD